jgi:hypothetical protein
MTPKSRFFQASFAAALAIALIVPASPARAEVITLVCTNESSGGGSFTLRVDYDRNIVDMPNSADMPNSIGTAYYSAAATITKDDVTWDINTDRIFRGSLNRLSGQGTVSFAKNDGSRTLGLSGPCRRATQKF